MADPSKQSNPPVGLDPEAILALTDDEASSGENGTEQGQEVEASQLADSRVELRVEGSPCGEEPIHPPPMSQKPATLGHSSDIRSASAFNSQGSDADSSQSLQDDEDFLAKVLQARSDAAARDSSCCDESGAVKAKEKTEGTSSKHIYSHIPNSKEEAIKTDVALMNSLARQSELERSIIGYTKEDEPHKKILSSCSDNPRDSTGPAPVLFREPGRRSESVPGAHALAFTGGPPQHLSGTGEETSVQEHDPSTPQGPLSSEGLAVANPVDEEQGGPASRLPRAESEEERRRNRQRKQRNAFAKQASILMCMCLTLVALVAIPIVMVVWRNESKSNISTGNGSIAADEKDAATEDIVSADSTTKMQDYLAEILPQYTLETIQDDTHSPQGKAYLWMLDDLNASDEIFEPWRILQRFGLATLFYSTLGEDWTHSNGWLKHSLHECLWFSQDSFIEGQFSYDFVDLRHTNPCEIPQKKTNTTMLEDNLEFQHLWLRSNNLKGVLPPELFLLTSLKSLTMRKNSLLVGTIPTMLGMLTRLEAISLSGTQITGSIPTQVGSLSLLRSLHLVYAKLDGPIPSEIGKLTKLHDMLVDSNSITGTLPTEFANLSDLAWFTSYLNQLTGTIPDWINNQTVPHMEEFQIDFNHFTGTIPTQLGTLGDSLLTLWLAGNHLSGCIPSEVGNLVNLVGFYPYKNALTGSIPSQLGKCASLVGTSLDNNHFTGTIPTDLAQLTGVQYLLLDSNRLTGSIPSELGLLEFPHPKGGQLSFHDNQLSGTIPSELALPTALVSLNFGFNRLSGTIPTHFGLLPNLTEFNVTSNPLLSGVIPAHLCQLENLVFDCLSSLCGCDCSCTVEPEQEANTTYPVHSGSIASGHASNGTQVVNAGSL